MPPARSHGVSAASARALKPPMRAAKPVGPVEPLARRLAPLARMETHGDGMATALFGGACGRRGAPTAAGCEGTNGDEQRSEARHHEPE